MSLVLIASMTATLATVPHCSWDRPGHNPYMGNLAASVDRYSDIPAPVRAKLQQRIAERRYDEIVLIKRDSITGRHAYAPEITSMHFGNGQVCGTVTRAKWSTSAEERGLVYCESGHCLLIPTVCRNLSRIVRQPGGASTAAAEGGGGGGGEGGGVVAGAPASSSSDELLFEPPGAGVPATPGPTFNELASAAPLGASGSASGAPGPTTVADAGPPGLVAGPSGGDGGARPSVYGDPEPRSFAPFLFDPQELAPQSAAPLVPLQAVPEPASALLLLGGLAGLLAVRRHRARGAVQG